MDRLKNKPEISEMIRTEIARKNISNKDLAVAMGISQTTMSAIRHGNSSYELMVKTMDTIDNWEN